MSFFGFSRADGGDDDDGFSQLNSDRAVSLFGEFTCFNGDLFVPYRGGGFFWHNVLSLRCHRETSVNSESARS